MYWYENKLTTYDMLWRVLNILEFLILERLFHIYIEYYIELILVRSILVERRIIQVTQGQIEVKDR